jgi:hypothetical protein
MAQESGVKARIPVVVLIAAVEGEELGEVGRHFFIGRAKKISGDL